MFPWNAEYKKMIIILKTIFSVCLSVDACVEILVGPNFKIAHNGT